MGDYYQIIVDPEASEDEAESLAASIVEWLIAGGIIEPCFLEVVAKHLEGTSLVGEPFG